MQMPLVLLTYYCALILVASIIGGMIPVWFQLTHRWMQFAVSFVAGVMLGVGVLHMLPHAIADASAAATLATTNGSADPSASMAAAQMTAVRSTMMWLLAGMLVMFFIERFFSYHHHDVPASDEHGHDHHHVHDDHDHHEAHEHDISWSGAALGLMLHSILNGVALAASVRHGNDGSSWLAGFGTFLVIFLHKPFDAMTIGMLMARGGWSLPWRHTVNALFSLAIPIGVLIFYFGLMGETADSASSARLWAAYALSFSAGTFLCISLSDLLPELQFHRHDRVKLSIALILGLAVAQAAAMMEAAAHGAHSHAIPPAVSPTSPAP
jgi:zinc and cadmium transporter